MTTLTTGLVAAILSAVPAAATAGPDPKAADPWDQEQGFESMPSGQRARLGVMVTEMTPELRDFFGATRDKGVLVEKIEPSSAAAKAGIKVGDVIVEVRGNAIEDAGDVVQALSDSKTGDVDVEVVRDHKPVTLHATIDKSPAKHEHSAWREKFPWFRPDLDAPARG
jgi:C-terminal processing protease CtpA/Prc